MNGENSPEIDQLIWHYLEIKCLLYSQCKLLCTTSIPQKSNFFHNRIFTLMKMIVIWKKLFSSCISLSRGDFDTNKKNKNSFICYLQFISNLLCTTFFSSCFVFIMTRGLEGEANIIFFQIPPNWIGIELLDK